MNSATGIMNVWINPNSSDFEGSAPAVTISAVDASPAASLDQFAFRQDSSSETGFIEADELRLGTSWADVTPATLSLDSFTANSIKLYPNPNGIGTLNVSSVNGGAINAKVFDIIGKQVIDTTVNNNTIDVSSLNSGMYIVRLTQGNSTITKKLIIE